MNRTLSVNFQMRAAYAIYPQNMHIRDDIYNAKMRAATEINILMDAGTIMGNTPEDGSQGIDKKHHSPALFWKNFKMYAVKTECS